MNKPSVFSAIPIVALLASATPSQARWMNPQTGRFHTMDTFEGDKRDPASLHKYAYCRSDPINRTDPTGKDAAVVNWGGYLGHTCFVLTHPQGGIRIYHFYAKGHNATANSFQNIQGAVYDDSWVWPENRTGLGVYLDELAKRKAEGVAEIAWRAATGYNVDVQAYAVGTPADDKRMYDLMESRLGTGEGAYSFVTGLECHHASWSWFRDYVGWGASALPFFATQRPPGLSPQGASKVNFPNGIYLTPGTRMPRFRTPGVVPIPLDIPGVDF